MRFCNILILSIQFPDNQSNNLIRLSDCERYKKLVNEQNVFMFGQTLNPKPNPALTYHNKVKYNNKVKGEINLWGNYYFKMYVHFLLHVQRLFWGKPCWQGVLTTVTLNMVWEQCQCVLCKSPSLSFSVSFSL